MDTGDAQLNPLMQEIHEYTDHAASYTIWWDNLLEGTDAARYLDSWNACFAGYHAGGIYKPYERVKAR